MNSKNYQKKCADLLDAVNKAQAWVKKNKKFNDSLKESLELFLNRSTRLIRKLGKASEKNMAVAVFGQSQAGKSYLLSALLPKEGKSVRIQIGEKEYDFLVDLNPPGGIESTALVTRFTTREEPSPFKEFPIGIELFSEIDFIKIIADTYFLDCDDGEGMPEKDLQNAIATLEEEILQESSESAISILDAEELEEYVSKDLNKSTLHQKNLKKYFWEKAKLLLPKASLEKRLELYSLIWNKVPEFTANTKQILETLHKIGSPEKLFINEAALLPRTRSILNVASLNPDDENGKPGIAKDKIRIKRRDGQEFVVEKGDLGALTSEIIFKIQETNDPFFHQVDLLDFPGYRPRNPEKNFRENLRNASCFARDHLRRGKVSYLFRQYSENRLLNGLLLCIKESNQDVPGLPEVLNSWVEKVRKATPANAASPSYEPLYIILTKADLECQGKGGVTDFSEVWEARYTASLVEFLGTKSPWLNDWKNGKPFKNAFILRNPTIEGGFAVVEDGIEKRLLAPQRLEEVRTSFLNSQLVNTYTFNPEKNWESFITLNDGGISFIKSSLAPFTQPEIKGNQLEAELFEEARHLFHKFENYYSSGNQDKEAEKIDSILGSFLDPFTKSDLKTLVKKFSEFQTELLLEPEELVPSYQKGEMLFKLLQKSKPEDGSKKPKVGFRALMAKASQKEQAPNEPKTVDTFFVEEIFLYWEEKLSRISQDPQLLNYYGLDDLEDETKRILEEILKGAVREGLKAELNARFKNITNERTDAKQEDVLREKTAVASALVNNFVSWLGFDPHKKSPQERLSALTEEELFKDRGKCLGSFELPPEQQYDQQRKDWGIEWLSALFTLIQKNLSITPSDLEGNREIGEILSLIEAVYDN